MDGVIKGVAAYDFVIFLQVGEFRNEFDIEFGWLRIDRRAHSSDPWVNQTEPSIPLFMTPPDNPQVVICSQELSSFAYRFVVYSGFNFIFHAGVAFDDYPWTFTENPTQNP